MRENPYLAWESRGFPTQLPLPLVSELSFHA